MDRKQLATVAMICGIVAFIAVFLPWYSISVTMSGDASALGGMLGGANRSESANGTEGDFSGVFVIILALLGAATAALVMLRKTDVLPLDERQHLFAALGLFALAAIVTLTDVFRDIPGGSESMGGVTVDAGKSFGLYLTLIATLAGAAAAFLASQKPGSGSASTTDE